MRIGIIALTDCSSIVMAHELGLFKKHGIESTISKEASWAVIDDITLGVERHRLREGDCLAMQLDRPTLFHNPTRKPARYAVVIARETPSRR